MLEGRLDLRAVEPDGAVDAAVADEDDVVVGGEPTGVCELHVRDAGAAFQAEDRGARVCRMRTDPDDRQRDQPRVRVGAVLGHHERSAVGGVGALLGVVGTVLERQLACMRAGRHGDGRRTAGEVEVAEPEREDGDQGQAGDPAATEASGRGMPVGRHGHAASSFGLDFGHDDRLSVQRGRNQGAWQASVTSGSGPGYVGLPPARGGQPYGTNRGAAR